MNRRSGKSNNRPFSSLPAGPKAASRPLGKIPTHPRASNISTTRQNLNTNSKYNSSKARGPNTLPSSPSSILNSGSSKTASEINTDAVAATSTANNSKSSKFTFKQLPRKPTNQNVSPSSSTLPHAPIHSSSRQYNTKKSKYNDKSYLHRIVALQQNLFGQKLKSKQLTKSHVSTRFQSSIKASTRIISIEWDPTGNHLAFTKSDGTLCFMKVPARDISADRKTPLPKEEKIGGKNKYGHTLLKFGYVLNNGISWNRLAPVKFCVCGHEYIDYEDTKGRGFLRVYEYNSSFEEKLTLVDKRYFDDDRIFDCKYSPVSDMVVIVTESNKLHFLNETLEIVNTIQYENSIYSICWNNNGKFLFVGFKSGEVDVLKQINNDNDEENGLSYKFQSVYKMYPHCSKITTIAVDGRGKFVAFSSDDGLVSLWNLNDLSLIKVIESDSGFKIVSISISQDGLTLGISYENQNKERYVNLVFWPFSTSLLNLKGSTLVKFLERKTSFILSNSNNEIEYYSC
ncbi:Tex1p SCDLUD_003918 [Saccharomycodes ludwigii]|uniref:Tex1p n=1 Tax=Saccharomycodes ludwigii TaxID=36035 RepID=UPI001E8B2659|nr:hypothetical protein SCDLUD_003918 [Saccharomycodes ludwigii]KAH3899637.1 hypothetical protein SCDLUD_003918 [Saccharomycodes ludwigii]